MFGRDTGPSSEDLNYSNNNHIPGLLIDYDGQEIVMGHYINLPFKVYTYGPLRRTFY